MIVNFFTTWQLRIYCTFDNDGLKCIAELKTTNKVLLRKGGKENHLGAIYTEMVLSQVVRYCESARTESFARMVVLVVNRLLTKERH